MHPRARHPMRSSVNVHSSVAVARTGPGRSRSCVPDITSWSSPGNPAWMLYRTRGYRFSKSMMPTLPDAPDIGSRVSETTPESTDSVALTGNGALCGHAVQTGDPEDHPV